MLYLVATRGPDAGARLAVGAEGRVIGRGRDVDLVLRDRCISRRHLEVRAEGEGARVVALADAAPFVFEDAEATSALLAVGATVAVGDTILALLSDVDDGGLPPESRPVESADVRTLFGGAALEVRGLAVVAALVDALDGIASVAEVAPCVDEWAKAHAGAEEGEVLVAGVAPAERLAGLLSRPGELVVLPAPGGGGISVVVPAHAHTMTWLSLRLPYRSQELTDAQRRLFVVAGRVLGSSLSRVRALEAARDDVAALRTQALGSASAFLGTSPAAARVAELVPRLSRTDATVLIRGETGTGKTFVARLIHETGSRAREPFRTVNCAAIPENLVESELFGHERGAFTGAVGARVGAFEAAGQGTLFLDEIGELPLPSQAKLLHAIEERRFERLGSNRALTLKARVLCATNRDLGEMAKVGTFRKDLLFRISVVDVHVPPLRERGEDVITLARQILADFMPAAGRPIADFSRDALEAIRTYPWPGNVRELRNAIESAVVLGDGPIIDLRDLPATIVACVAAAKGAMAEPEDVYALRLPMPLDALEKRAIAAALAATNGHRARAAALLGINRVTLYKKLKGAAVAGDGADPADAGGASEDEDGGADAP